MDRTSNDALPLLASACTYSLRRLGALDRLRSFPRFEHILLPAIAAFHCFFRNDDKLAYNMRCLFTGLGM